MGLGATLSGRVGPPAFPTCVLRIGGRVTVTAVYWLWLGAPPPECSGYWGVMPVSVCWTPQPLGPWELPALLRLMPPHAGMFLPQTVVSQRRSVHAHSPCPRGAGDPSGVVRQPCAGGGPGVRVTARRASSASAPRGGYLL